MLTRDLISSRHLLASLLFISFSIPASAAETPAWQGPYIGAYLGGSFGNNHVSTDAGTATNNAYFATSADINAVDNAASFNKNPASVIGGIQAGQDWSLKKMVFGVAVDYSTLSLSSSKNVNNITYPDNTDQYSVHTHMSTNWLFTLRGRLGYQAPLHWPSLFYITGGMAITPIKISNSFSDNAALAGTGGNSISKNQIGWTAGAGIELALLSHMSVDFEYAYIEVPSVKITSSIYNTAAGFGTPPHSQISPFSTTGQFHANLLKIGLNYRFD